MKKILLIVLTILLALNVPAFAKPTSILNGNAHLNKGEYDSLEINGKLTFKNLSIKDLLVINGSIQGENLNCKTMKSNGSVDIDGFQAQVVQNNGLFLGKNIDIKGSSEFNGGLEIKNGKLHDIQITSARAILIGTQVNGNIRIKKINTGWNVFGLKFKESSIQILELRGNSLVSGDIFFEQNGEVHLFDGSKVEGKIVNAKVIQK